MTRSDCYFRFPLSLLVVPLLALLLLVTGCGSEDAPPLTDATEQATSLLPASSDMVAMVDLVHARDHSPAAQAVFDKMLPDLEQSPEARAHLDAMNIDLEADVRRVYAGGGLATEPRKPLFLVYGSFDTEAINDHLRSEAAADSLRARLIELNGRPAITMNERDPSFAAVVANESLVLIGERAEVEAALGRVDGDATGSLSESTDKVALLREAARGQSMWAALMSIPEEMRSNGPDRVQKITSIAQAGTASFTFQNDGSLDARMLVKAGDAETASDLADVMRGLVGLSKRQVSEEPELQDVLQSVKVNSRDTDVTVTGQIPASVIDKRFNPQPATSAL
ncbi:hypothetical protein [Longibacter sp.]|jgi:hypothetical protein|uniref:hypothetical protein n=1 Tax=Longibacter sp. TaxID=2045415 RepID=UPI003EBE6D94